MEPNYLIMLDYCTGQIIKIKLSVFVWKFAIAPMGGVLSIYELLPAFLCAFAAIIIVSLLTGAPETEAALEYETVKAELHK